PARVVTDIDTHIHTQTFTISVLLLFSPAHSPKIFAPQTCTHTPTHTHTHTHTPAHTHRHTHTHTHTHTHDGECGISHGPHSFLPVTVLLQDTLALLTQHRQFPFA